MSISKADASTKGSRTISEVCVLGDGSRVRFSLKRRGRDPFYLACFRGHDGKPKERSTKEKNQRRAIDAAVVIIREDYTPKVSVLNPTWEEAVNKMLPYMKAENLRPGSIKQYEYAVTNLRKAFPETHGPASITPVMAQEFKVRRLNDEVKPRSVAGNIDNLSIVYGHWWRDTLKIVNGNPFEGVSPPKYDKPQPRVISDDEERKFLAWLGTKWKGCRIPLLFLEIKKAIGCRIGELANLATSDLKDGRLCFEEVNTKGRKQRAVKIPIALYDELVSVAGPRYVFEKFAGQLRACHIKRGDFQSAQAVNSFTPIRLIRWLQRQLSAYFKEHPKAKKFKLHNFRGTAMSRARMAGVSFDDAAVAFGCNPQTMRQHYISLDEVEISDRVMEKIQSKT